MRRHHHALALVCLLGIVILVAVANHVAGNDVGTTVTAAVAVLILTFVVVTWIRKDDNFHS